jgi:hypothetical protein
VLDFKSTGLVILNNKGEIRLVYKDSKNAIRRKTTQLTTRLPINIDINLNTMLSRTVIMNIKLRYIKLFSIENLLDNSITIKPHKGNNNTFMPTVFMPEISFNMPAKTAKAITHLDSKNRLAIIMLAKRRSGFTPNILK